MTVAGLRRLLSTSALAGANLAITTALLIVPSLLHASNGSILALSVFLVSLQAGQAASVQTDATIDRQGSVLEASASVALLVSAALALTLGFDWPTLLVTSAAGLLAGLVTGPRANTLLRSTGGAVRYQLFLLGRNGVWLLCVVLASILLGSGAYWGTVVVWLIFTVELWRRGSRSFRLRFPVRGVTVAGALAALAYRNDVNIVRAAADGAGVFESWHFLLTAYSIAQAVTGFLILQYFYAGSRDGKPRRPALTSLRYVPGAIALMSVAVGIVLGTRAGLVPIAVVTLVAGCAVSIQAAIAHVAHRSYGVYAAGLAGVGTCWVLAQLGFSPEFIMGANLGVSGAIVLTTLIILRRARLAPASSIDRGSVQHS